MGTGVDRETKKNDKTLLEAIQAISISSPDPEDATQTITTTPFKDCEDASEVAEALSSAGDDADITKKFAEVVKPYLVLKENCSATTLALGSYRIDGLDPGYYLVKDRDGQLGIDDHDQPTDKDKDDAYTRYILTVAGDVTVNPKSTKPSVEKKVYEESLADETGNIYGAGYNDVADYDIGDYVPFKLYGSLPDDETEYNAYDAYFYQFVDTIGPQFNIGETNNLEKLIHVYYEENNGTKREIVNVLPTGANKDDYIVLQNGNNITKGWSTGTGDHILTVTIEDIKEFAKVGEGKITVEYKAELTGEAKVGYEGQVNGVHLNYSNNPNEHWKPSENSTTSPETPDNKGQTPEDGVVVFTYGIDINKVIAGTGDKDQGVLAKKLAGAKFAVYCQAYETETITVTETITDPNDLTKEINVKSEKTEEYLKWNYKIDNTATVYYTKKGENPIQYYTMTESDGTKTFTKVDTVIDTENGKLEAAKAYIATVNDKFDHYITNESSFPNAETQNPQDSNYVWVSTENNNITIKGLDKDRKYYIEELEAPDGYNKLKKPVEVEIISTFTGEETGATAKEIYPNHEWTYSVNGNVQKGEKTALDDIHLIVDNLVESKIDDEVYDNNSSKSGDDLGTVEIENNSGTELPDTGGIGTTLFYVGGSIMVAVAGVFLITNKRTVRKKD